MNAIRKILSAAALSAGLLTNGIVAAQNLQPGVVVEKVAQNSEAERAKLQEGDRLLAWSRGDARGEIASPFDLSQTETEQAPRGNVILKGLRGTQKQTWTLGPASWGITARPNFPEALLASYGEGQQWAEAGKLTEAAERWKQIAKQLDDSQPAWLKVWLLSHSADLFSAARQWQEAGVSYQDAIQQTSTPAPHIAAQLFRSLAFTYQKRNDWASAEKYYQQAMTESRKMSPESLTMAALLNDLGQIADFHGDLAKAEEYFTQSLAMREKLAPESLSVSASLNDLGAVAIKRGDTVKADQYLQRASAICQKLAPGSLDAARSLNSLGDLARYRVDLSRAEDYYHQSLEIRQKLAPESLDLAATLTNLGVIIWYHGDLATAADYHRRALEIEKKLAPDSLDVASTLVNAATAAWARGELIEAEENDRQAVAIYEKLAPDSLGMAGSLRQLGMVCLERKDLAKAEEYTRRSLMIVKKQAPERIDVGFCLNNLGTISLWRGDLENAEKYYEQALAIKEKAAPESERVAITLNQIGSVAFSRRELDKAEKYFLHALAIREKTVPNSNEIGESYARLGDVAAGQNDLDKAEAYYRKALAIRERLMPISKERVETLADLAMILQRKQQPEAAAQFFEQALDVLERQNASLGGSEAVRAGFRSDREHYYKIYVDLLVSQNHPEHAFQVLEQGRARTLLETLAAAHVDIRTGVDPSLLEQEREFQQSYKKKSELRAQLLAGQHTEEQLAVVEKEIASLLGEQGRIEGQIRATSPGYSALIQPQPLSAHEVQQQLLDPHTLLLEYSLGPDRSYVFAVSSDSLHAYELPKKSEIEGIAGRVYELLTARNRELRDEKAEQRQMRVAKAEREYSAAAAELSRVILGPVARELKGKRLLIVADGTLQYVPFAALPAPETDEAKSNQPSLPLIMEHEIVNLPSASVLAVLRQEEETRQQASLAVAVFGDPVFDVRDDRVSNRIKAIEHGGSATRGDDHDKELSDASTNALLRSMTDVGLGSGTLKLSRLPFTRAEAEAIFAATPRGQAMKALDFDASRATATSPELAKYRIVHFATHGLLDSEHPELSGLVLSMVDRNGKHQDGFLELQDIYNLNLPADLVVLSACETGLGKEVSGEGLIGLTRGFMYAGASRVVASLWKVSDVGTAKLMAQFYRSMEREKQTPAAALRAAQVAMWKQPRWRSPYYWAAFQIQGEWK